MTRRTSSYGIIKFCFCIGQLLNVLGYITNCLGIESVFSLVSRSYIILNVLSFLLFFLDHAASNSKSKGLLLLIMMGLSTLLAYFVHGSGVSMFNFVLILAAYLSLPMYIMYMDVLELDTGIYKVIKLSAIVTALFFIFRNVTHPEYSLRGDLTLGYFNANYLAILLIQNMSILLVLRFFDYRRLSRLVFWVLFLAEAYLVYKTNCRTAFVCVLVLFLFPLRKRKTVSRTMSNIFLIAPVLFVLVLNYMSSRGLLNGVEILGKPLFSGRETMFDFTVYSIMRNPLFGLFNEYQLGNAHNAFLSVLASVGIIGFVFFYAFYYQTISSYRDQLHGNEVNYVAFIGILILFLEGCAETSVLLSGSMYAAATSPLLLFVRYTDDLNSEGMIV